jgi:hypothetical protein
VVLEGQGVGVRIILKFILNGRMPRIKEAGDICLRRPRPTQGCRADDDDDDDDDNNDNDDLK